MDMEDMDPEQLSLRKAREKFWEQRQHNSSYYCSNRIVEICYGHHGLILFLDLLFTQFPSKRQTKAKFNYYFAMRKQIASIEQHIQDELTHGKDASKFDKWFDNRSNLLEALVPQRGMSNMSTKARKVAPNANADDSPLLPEPKLRVN